MASRDRRREMMTLEANRRALLRDQIENGEIEVAATLAAVKSNIYRRRIA